MRPLYTLIGLAVAGLVCITACSKKSNDGTGAQPTETIPASPAPTFFSSGVSLNKVFRELRSTPETKCITAGKLQTITFAKGTRLTFYPNSFQDGTGKTISSGTVCLEVTEIYKPGDMISNRVVTMNPSYILRSGGQVNIKATKDGQTVYARKYGIDFKQTGPSMQPMALFYGNMQNKDSLVMWGNPMTGAGMTVPGTSDTIPPAPGDTTGGWGVGMYYQFDSCTDFNWVNCDYFYTATGAKTQIKVVVTDLAATAQNTQVLMVFPSLNAVLPLYANSTAPLTYKSGDVPEGLTAHVVVVSKRENNQYYYWEALGFNVSTLMQLDATTTPQTIAYVKNKLATLP